MAFKGKMKSDLASKSTKISSSSGSIQIQSVTQDSFWPTIDDGQNTAQVRGFYNSFYARIMYFRATGLANSDAESLFRTVIYPSLVSNYGRITGNNYIFNTVDLENYFDTIATALIFYYQFTHILKVAKAGIQNPAVLASANRIQQGGRIALQRLADTLSGLAVPKGLHDLAYWYSQLRWLSPEKFSPVGMLASEYHTFVGNDMTDSTMVSYVDSLLGTSISGLNNPSFYPIIQALRAMGKDDMWKLTLKDVPETITYDPDWHNVWSNLGCSFNNAGTNNNSFVNSRNFELKLISQTEKWNGLCDALMAVTVGATSTTSAVFQPGLHGAFPHLANANASSIVCANANVNGGFGTVRSDSALANGDFVEGCSGASGSLTFRNLSTCGKQRVQWTVQGAQQPLLDVLRYMYDIVALNSSPSRF